MGTDEDKRELAQRFHQYVTGDADYLRSRGYNATYFHRMISEHGSGVTVTKLLLSSSRHTTHGFQRLWEMGELGRSVEFAALLPWFAPLFTDEELEEARYRLTEHKFPVEERLAKATANPPDWARR